MHFVNTTEEERQRPSLTEGQVLALSRLGVEIASHYGRPQDLEWAVTQGGAIYLLQARPITAFKVSHAGRWSHAAFTDACLLTLSMMARSYASMMYCTLQQNDGEAVPELAQSTWEAASTLPIAAPGSARQLRFDCRLHRSRSTTT